MNRPNNISAAVAEPPVRGLDAVAMLLSGLCLIHCLALPLLVAALPLAASSLVADERFHQWLLLGAVPTSVIALGWGWRRHRDNLVAGLGIVGLILMVFAAFGIQTGLIDAHGERVLTVIGALMLAIAHLRNYQLRHHGHDHSQPHAPH
ncbi:MerC domain-containing protein [uncultured Nevskia sp.]|uniref:MerC domain-containing protein n=1 Tax=uncultured Nevskia sp. TaxID=228950 RepID=UPI0025CEB178|nr:MerC domain-containing protein [uncultured Nevskia sp.]